MGLYNMIFGKNRLTGLLLAMLKLTEDDFYRFRDCYAAENDEIAIYTRGGGNNRVEPLQKALRSHPQYLRDEDDDFDNTYATFYFRIPDEYKEALAKLEVTPEPKRDQVWADLLQQLNKEGINTPGMA